MKTIVAIGGGELRHNETFAIDEYIVKLSNKENPKLLFIPTASGEPEGYMNTVNRVYGNELRCIVDTLKILTETPSDEAIREKILSADIIYVGGGNTAKMMDAWKEKNVDKYLWEAYNKGVILSGLSAGSICWFDCGHSDSFFEQSNEYGIVKGLGMIHALHCPHYDERPNFDDFMKTQNIPAVAIEANCALAVQDEYYKIIKSQESAKAFLIKNENGTVKKHQIINSEFKPINTLL